MRQAGRQGRNETFSQGGVEAAARGVRGVAGSRAGWTAGPGGTTLASMEPQICNPTRERLEELAAVMRLPAGWPRVAEPVGSVN